MNISSIAETVGQFLKQNTTVLLTTTAVAGIVTTGVLAAKSGHPAGEAIRDKTYTEDRVLTFPEKFTTVWKYYIPAATMGAVTIGCVVGLNTVHSRRAAILAGAYSVTERALDEYKKQVEAEVTPEKYEKIKDRVAQAEIDRNPVEYHTRVVFADPDDVLCYDPYSGRYFGSSIEKLRRAENNLNQRLIASHFLSLNDLYSEIGLDTIVLGDDIGWVPDNLIIMDFRSAITKNDIPCIVMRYEVEPSLDIYRS